MADSYGRDERWSQDAPPIANPRGTLPSLIPPPPPPPPSTRPPPAPDADIITATVLAPPPGVEVLTAVVPPPVAATMSASAPPPIAAMMATEVLPPPGAWVPAASVPAPPSADAVAVPSTELVAEAAESEPDEEEPTTRESWFRVATPMLTSMLVHLVGLIVLAMLLVPEQKPDRTIRLAAVTEPMEDLVEDEDLAIERADRAPRIRLESDISLDLSSIDSAAREVPADTHDFDWRDPADRRGELLDDLPFDETARPRGGGKPGGANEVAGTRLGEAGTVEDALGNVLDDVQRAIAEGDLLVVWLLDASISLTEDRPKVAGKLETLFDRAAARSNKKDSYMFMNAAVAFGNQTLEMVAPTKLSRRVVTAVEQVPTDVTGVENTFGAVEWVVHRYAKRWKSKLLVVVWTDETGDDIEKLEPTIDLCLKRNVVVSVVGPSAVLGRQDGVQAWTAPMNGQVFYLPVTRGPDSALPERLQLPYWYLTRLPSSRRLSEWAGMLTQGADGLPPWYGGRQLEGMIAGFGPYALTRLALETGGTYTIIDRPADRGPFRIKDLTAYRPDYRSSDEILDELRYQPLRRAVLGAVAVLAEHPVKPPQMSFLNSGYMTPVEFRAGLRRVLPQQMAQAAQAVAAIDAALVPLGRDKGMEADRDNEQSPRWRAWYDLTRGRLLAMAVRYREYGLACQSLLYVLNPATNHVDFFATEELRTAATTQAMADEAVQLLQRCVKDNPDTPWAYLAERELAYSLGVGIGQRVIPPPPPKLPTPAVPHIPHMPIMPGPRPPAFTPPKL